MKIILSLLSLLLTVSGFSQATLTVTNLNDSGPGSLRQQVFNSSSGDFIKFDASLLAGGSDTLFLNFPIIIDNGVSIRGLIRGGDTLYISGHDSTQIFFMNFANIPNQEIYLDSLVVLDAKLDGQNGSGSLQNGGAIFASNLDTLVITNSLFRNCHAAGGHGGAIYSVNTDLVISESNFIGNHTDSVHVSGKGGRSGALEVRYGELYIDGAEFIGNYSGDRGGAMYLYYSNFEIKNSHFIRNRTGVINTSAGFLEGGAIRVFEGTNGVILNSSFISNSALEDGGAILLNAPFSDLIVHVDNCIFQKNSTSHQAGAIFATDTELHLNNSSFIENKSLSTFQYYGGSVLGFYGGSVDINNCSFVGNESYGGAGGSILLSTTNVNILNSTFYNNTSISGINITAAYSSSVDTIEVGSSIFYSSSDSTNITPNATSTSLGNNIFSDSPSFAIASDQVNIDSATLALEPLAMNGGTTPTLLPSLSSVALNLGGPTDFSDAQNGPIYGRRDVGAAERPVIVNDTTLACSPISWWGNTYNNTGTYVDTVFNANSIDSVGFLVLELQDTGLTIYQGVIYALEDDTNTTYQWVDCNNGYALLQGETNQDYFPTSNGSYAVILTNGNCIDTSSCITYQEFNVDERTLTSDWLRFYPNPTSGTLHFRSEGVIPSSVELVDLSGRLVYSTQIYGESTIELPELSIGTYIVRWRGTEGEVQIDRVVIE